jgi:hypothetical protein
MVILGPPPPVPPPPTTDDDDDDIDSECRKCAFRWGGAYGDEAKDEDAVMLWFSMCFRSQE